VVVPSVNRGVPFMMGDRSKQIARSFHALTEVVRQQLAGLEGEREALEAGRNGRK
jgi:hypothetical protein